jgi:hypothetical protein
MRERGNVLLQLLLLLLLWWLLLLLLLRERRWLLLLLLLPVLLFQAFINLRSGEGGQRVKGGREQRLQQRIIRVKRRVTLMQSLPFHLLPLHPWDMLEKFDIPCHTNTLQGGIPHPPPLRLLIQTHADTPNPTII